MSRARYLDRAEVLRLSGQLDVEAALERVLREAETGTAGQLTRIELAPEGMSSVLGIMPSYRRAERAAFAVKAVCVVPDNPRRGLPAHQGLAVLFDAEGGGVRLLADAAAVTEVRTAALTALAIRTLAPDPRGPLLVIGAGHQAVAHLRTLSRQERPLRVWARRSEQSRAVAESLAAEGIAVSVARELRPAVEDADVVVTLTGATAPILEDAWLPPGVLVNAIGSSTPRVCEIPEATMRSSRLVADDPEAAMRLAGEFARLTPPVPRPVSLGSLLVGNAGPVDSRAERTVFTSVGVSLQDLALLEALDPLAADAGQIIAL